jgi:hypothetical protein
MSFWRVKRAVGSQSPWHFLNGKVLWKLLRGFELAQVWAFLDKRKEICSKISSFFLGAPFMLVIQRVLCL